MTDGGHSDNLGLLQLFKRRAKLIISLDASYDPEISCEDLIWALGTIKNDAVMKAEIVKPNGEIKLISIDEVNEFSKVINSLGNPKI